MLKRLLALLVLPVATLFVIAGCSTTPAPSSNGDDDKTSQSDEGDDDESEAPAEGELADPGTRVGEGEWLTHSFTSTDDGEALISAQLVSVEPATDEEAAFIVAAFDAGKLDGYDFWLIHVDEKKESGDSIAFDSDYAYFDVVDEDGTQVQGITLIGWDGCPSESFSEEFDTAGAVITQCFIAAAKDGDNEPAGVSYGGGYEDDNPYEDKPLLFIKG